MKKAAIYFFSLLLGLFLLMFSMGLTLNKMVCLSSGKVKVSLLDIKHCGPEESKSPCHSALKNKCCDITSSFLHIAIPSVVFYSFVKITDIDVLFTGYILNIFKISTSLSLTSFIFSDLPPPLIGKDFLNFIQILRI